MEKHLFLSGFRFHAAMIAWVVGGSAASVASEIHEVVTVWHPGHPGFYFGTPNCATPMQLSFFVCLPQAEQVDFSRSTVRDIERQGLPLPNELKRDSQNGNCAVAVVRAVPDHAGTAPNYKCLGLGFARADVKLIGVTTSQKNKLRPLRQQKTL